jgi:TetR/AcrR family transcriptional repressor of nem operon
MRYDGEHKQRTRERVLKEAGKAIRAQGPMKVGVAEVMAKAGLTHGGFYAHFANRDEMLGAAVDQMFVEAGARFKIETGSQADAARALAAYIDFYLSRAHRDTRTSGCPLPFLSADAPRLPPAARWSYAAGVERMTAVIADLLMGMGHAQPHAAASSALSEMVGALALSRADPDLARADARLADSRRSVKHRLGLEDVPGVSPTNWPPAPAAWISCGR